MALLDFEDPTLPKPTGRFGREAKDSQEERDAELTQPNNFQ